MPTDADPIAPPPAAPAVPTARARIQTGLATAGMLPVLIALCLVFSVANGRFATLQNAIVILQQTSVNLVLACGMTFVILTGGIDLSVGAILAAAAMAGLIVSLDPSIAIFAIPAALAVGAGFGLLNGILIAGIRLPPFIVTLGGLTAIRGVARLMGGDRTVFNSDLPYAVIGNDSIWGIPWLVIIALSVVLMSWFVLRRTVFGRYVYAIGGNAEAARLAGIKVGFILVLVYGLSGILAGLGGVMASARLFAANGQQLGMMYELDAVAAVILGGASLFGGAGSVWGTVVGALIIGVLTNGLILVGVSDVWQFITKGLIIIAAVALDRFRNRR
ncbi:ABC transporter permease [Paracoccus onubensis]|uniref:ABC transporter permease subunit n=1 Tax=Paracoccus onubensis TaxID=1675788 RepID=UPI0027320E51|nr:ABC transporter permease [Paracoccus onubensis]MDP0929499.1 ABC transporter permease [Paracoccus onubensis]